ncbi:mercury transporter [Pseudodesulfovibrio sp. JC047]|uniref:heavy-metal-associated domain-containing protein n=1 Tax=Pseudodesulfovibrio sp. JC047 TaxID=2683199 RepID=UPI0013D8317E|nr:cation transporter [Pseudodesulfovibrio sp. JC047]NDV20099.1 mercury transporter [Pseudodesulfovibrio sp. JC047]
MPTITVTGMSCQHCVASVTQALEALGTKNVTVDLLSGAVTFSENPSLSPEAVKEAITKIGFEVVAYRDI